MKIWIKLLIGIIIGALVALLFESDALLETFDAIAQVVVSIGRYVIFPLVLFSTIIGTYELQRDKRVFSVLGRVALFVTVTGVGLAAIGTLSTVLLSPDRIPIVIEEEVVYNVPTFAEVIDLVFPRNLFQVFNDSGSFLLPTFVLAFLVGVNLNFDRLATRPAIQLFDSLTRVFYNLNAFILELIGIGFIPLSAAMIMRLLAMPELILYRQIILVLFVDTIFVVLILYPVLLYFLAGRRNPFVQLYAGFANLLSAIVTGDGYFCLGSMIRHGKENYGVPRSIGAVSLPLFTLFGKAGTALVTGSSFVLIVTSYSSLGITLPQILWIIAGAFIASLVVGPFPGIGTFVALSILSKGFASGYAEGYLILRPIVPVLVSFSVLLDVLTASLSTMVIAHRMEVRKEIEAGEYI